MNTIELGRQMMANAAMLDDDAEFNQWTRLGPMLIAMGTGSASKDLNLLTPEEQQVVARAMNKLGNRQKVA